MKSAIVLLGCLAAVLGGTAGAAQPLEEDVIETSAGPLRVTFVGHGSLFFTFGGHVLHVDPWSQLADYGALPKADLVLITHEHRDHLDRKALELVRQARTVIIANEAAARQIPGAVTMRNGDTRRELGTGIEAVPAYNRVHKRDNGQPFHPPGIGNGYVLTFGDKRVYVAGDTENIPEMKALGAIDVAFLPMNLPYTMTPEMVADAAAAFRPLVLYPYHYGETDPAKLVDLLKDHRDIEVRIRNMR